LIRATKGEYDPCQKSKEGSLPANVEFLVVVALLDATQKSAKLESEVGRSPEETEALEQAKLWARTRAQGASDAGASDAAEFAIQRSLSHINK
jgi:hypothetical protein